LCLGTVALSQAQTTALTPPERRITDGAINTDLQTYESVQGRIKGLNDRGRPVRDYHLSKAQCWLDVSFHEYSRNDRSAFSQEALDQAVGLVQGMEQSKPLGYDTPLVNGAAKLREDLWQRAQTLRGHAGFACAQAKAACAEVELVHAGNEFNQQQWRHAKPYVQIAEDLVAEAQALAAACPVPPAPAPLAPLLPVVVAPPPPPPPPPPPAPLPALAPVRAELLFGFDRHGASDVQPASLATLDAALASVKRDKLKLLAVRLIGYADIRLRGGSADYNLRLSQRRVDTARELVRQRGFDPVLIGTDAKGGAAPVAECPASVQPKPGSLDDCLLPNRRVTVELVVARP
jgi:outer membrane protein OmpA-like peptidoglycan-associated protein